MSHKKVKKLAKKSKFVLLILVVMILPTIFFNFYSGLFASSDIISFLMIVSFFVVVFAIVVLLPKLIATIHPGKLSRYIMIKRNGEVVIKDPDFNTEMAKLKVKQVAEEVYDETYGVEEENRFYCPKCGKEYRQGIPFCNTCGKDLRVLIN